MFHAYYKRLKWSNGNFSRVTQPYLSNAAGSARHNVRLAGEILRQVVSCTRLGRAA